VQEQFEAVHNQAQIRERGFGCCFGIAGLHALGRAMEALAQGAKLIRVAQRAQQAAGVVRAALGLFDQRQGGGESNAVGLRILQHPALERAALPRSLGVNAASAILAQGRTGLGKASDGRLAAGKGNRQPERLQFPGIVARLEFDQIEERAVAAQAARPAELFA
jgi:hypothetical protein